MASPISAQQRSAEESRQEFDRRMRNMVSVLESTDTFFFYKLVSKCTATEVVPGPLAYSLEFPNDFLKQHSKKFDKDVTFGLKDSERTWPIKLTMRSFKQPEPKLTVRSFKQAKPSRVFAYGRGGWKTFLMDNHIKVGDVLIFVLISFSKFEVVLGRSPVEVHPNDDDDDNKDEMDIEDEDEDVDDDKSSAKWFRNSSPGWNGRNADQAPVSCRVCKQALPFPRFVVTIRPSHPRYLSMAVPGRFWELHGNMLECNDLQLKGPNKAIYMVKAKRTYDQEEEKLTVRLDSGWEAFRVANKLRVGDVLEFFLVGNSCFTVDLLERIEKYELARAL